MPTLNWLNRDAAFRAADAVPYHLLQPVSAHGNGDARNLLVQGDNLLALKALLPLYRGQVKCIFIDPPYNTKSAFEHYDDNLEHAQWLSMMLPRLQLLREFLREDGSIWVTIDDNEGHYLKVLMDEVFGRRNFVANIVWQSKDTPGNNSTGIAETHNHVFCFAKDIASFKPNMLERNESQLATYKNPDNDLRGPWLATPLTRAEFRERDSYPIRNAAGRAVVPPKGSSWRRPPEKMRELDADRRIWWGKSGDAEFPMEKKFLSEVKSGVVNQSWWPYEFAGSTRNASAELKGVFNGEKVFDTPKPERVLLRILNLATSPNDLILDSFLGSGTTAAVAHKMGRRWIGIEMGEHAVTHCLPRLEKVVAGEPGGISTAVNWAGGGGFRFMRLGEPVFDETGRINPGVRFAALAAFVWQQETRSAYVEAEAGGRPGTPLLGVHEGKTVLLLFNGILGDRRPEGGNVLNLAVLQALKRLLSPSGSHGGQLVVYGEACTLGEARLQAEGMVFRQIPYALAVR